jgi:hypothetical protein
MDRRTVQIKSRSKEAKRMRMAVACARIRSGRSDAAAQFFKQQVVIPGDCTKDFRDRQGRGGDANRFAELVALVNSSG